MVVGHFHVVKEGMALNIKICTVYICYLNSNYGEYTTQPTIKSYVEFRICEFESQICDFVLLVNENRRGT